MTEVKSICISEEQHELAVDRIPRLFFKYAVPGVIGLLFLGIQAVIDGIVLSHFAGARALASVSLVLPCYNLMVAMAIVIAIGCQALIGIRLGQSDIRSANNALTTAFVFLAVFSIGMSAAIYSMAGPLVGWLGADDVLRSDSVAYIRAISPFFPCLTLMFLGDYILKISGRPVYATCIMSGTVLVNILLDLLFVGLWGWGVAGAGVSTGIAFTLGAICNVPTMFNLKQAVCVRLGRFRWRLLGQMFYNGSSEGISELSAGISIFMFNWVMMTYVGPDGVAAFTVLGYILFIGVTVFLGISDGIIPIMSYNYGNNRQERVKSVLFLAARTNLIIGVSLFTLLLVGGKWVVALFFKSSETGVLDMAMQGASVYAVAFLFNGLNILASGFFTALGDAKWSVIVSLCRGLIFIALGVFCFPLWFGLKGIWLVIPVAELCTFLISLMLVYRKIRKLSEEKIGEIKVLD